MMIYNFTVGKTPSSESIGIEIISSDLYESTENYCTSLYKEKSMSGSMKLHDLPAVTL